MSSPLSVDLRGDHHVHSSFSDDAGSSPAENLAAAVARGLTTIRMVDHVRTTTNYVPEFLAAVRALPTVAGLQVLTGVEAKILDTAGTVDAPTDVLASIGGKGAGRVVLADHQLPGPKGPWSPREATAHVADGLDRTRVVDQLVTAYVAALRRTGPSQLAHPFSILPKVGLGEDDVGDDHLAALAAACLAAGALVEVNEKWRCPGPRITAALAAAGVVLVASSDAHNSRDVGAYRWLRQLVGGQ